MYILSNLISKENKYIYILNDHNIYHRKSYQKNIKITSERLTKEQESNNVHINIKRNSESIDNKNLSKQNFYLITIFEMREKDKFMLYGLDLINLKFSIIPN